MRMMRVNPMALNVPQRGWKVGLEPRVGELPRPRRTWPVTACELLRPALWPPGTERVRQPSGRR